MVSVLGTHGQFTREDDGRLSGWTFTVNRPRRDGKFPVSYAFGSGKHIRKLYTLEQCQS